MIIFITSSNAMYRQSFSAGQEEDQTPSSTRSAESDSFTARAIDNSVFPVDFSIDSTVFPRQDDLTTSFGSYIQISSFDETHEWARPQQQYADLAFSPVRQGLPPLLPRLSVAQSLVSDEGDDTSEPTSPRDEATQRRKERRRAQNRAAQRAFRARKEDTIKESSARLEVLQEELIRLECVNGNLSHTISRLRSEIAKLREENVALGRRRSKGMAACEYAQRHGGDSKAMLPCAKSIPNEHQGKFMGLGPNGNTIATAQWQETGDLEGEQQQ